MAGSNFFLLNNGKKNHLMVKKIWSNFLGDLTEPLPNLPMVVAYMTQCSFYSTITQVQAVP